MVKMSLRPFGSDTICSVEHLVVATSISFVCSPTTEFNTGLLPKMVSNENSRNNQSLERIKSKQIMSPSPGLSHRPSLPQQAASPPVMEESDLKIIIIPTALPSETCSSFGKPRFVPATPPWSNSGKLNRTNTSLWVGWLVATQPLLLHHS